MSVAIGLWNAGIAFSAKNKAGLRDDGAGSWVWAVPGAYGLSDDGAGSWVWTENPRYRLDTATFEWS